MKASSTLKSKSGCIRIEFRNFYTYCILSDKFNYFYLFIFFFKTIRSSFWNPEPVNIYFNCIRSYSWSFLLFFTRSFLQCKIRTWGILSFFHLGCEKIRSWNNLWILFFVPLFATTHYGSLTHKYDNCS